MKKLMMSALTICAVVGATAQEQTFKKFKVDVAAGYAIPGGSGSKGGILFAVEPKYALNDAVAVGLRMEAAVVARATANASGGFDDADVKAAGSYLATGDYYFNTNNLRPFAGAGLGIFTVAGATMSSNGSESVGAGNKFGGMVRAGIETGHFRAALEYNAVGSTETAGFDSNGAPMTTKLSNGYIGIKIGFFLGGGRL